MGWRLVSRLVFLACVALLFLFPAGTAAAPARCGVYAGLGSYSATVQPSSCWRPYAEQSPFNRPIPPGAPTTPDSAANVFRLLAGGSAEGWGLGDPLFDYGVPIYWSRAGDPTYTLHCTKPWGRCAIEGMRVRIPVQARPAGGYATPSYDHDAHLTVIDQASGWEYDLWNVSSKTGSTLNFGWGGRTRIDGDGLGSAAVAANYGSIAGPIRAAEMQAGEIQHALSMAIPCTNTSVYPATGTGANCAEAGLPSGLSIPMGTHFQLNMSPSEIAALAVPAWKKTILTALASYGAYVSDTTSLRTWGFEIESRESQTSFGRPDPWVQFAQRAGIGGLDSNGNGLPEYRLSMASGVPWARLRVVGVCVAAGTCALPAVQTIAPPVNAAAKNSRAARCWRKRAAWGREYRRTHERRDRRYFGVMSRWRQRCLRLDST